MLYAFYPSWMTLFIFVRWLQWNMGKNGLILSICSISIHNNGAEGSLSVSIEEMKELREFYLQNLMFVIIVLCDLGLLLSTRMQEILKNRPVKIWWGEIFTGWSRIFFPRFPSCVTDCFALPRRQGSLWLFIPSTGALADPVAVILDCMSTVPEKPSPAVIQGHHRFCYF